MKLRLVMTCTALLILSACNKQTESAAPAYSSFLDSYPARECRALALEFSRTVDSHNALVKKQEKAANSVNEKDIALAKEKIKEVGEKLVQTGC